MSPIKLKRIVEQLDVANQNKLAVESQKFANHILSTGVISSHHKDMTSSDLSPDTYTEDLAEIIRNAIVHWYETVNARGGR